MCCRIVRATVYSRWMSNERVVIPDADAELELRDI